MSKALPRDCSPEILWKAGHLRCTAIARNLDAKMRVARGADSRVAAPCGGRATRTLVDPWGAVDRGRSGRL